MPVQQLGIKFITMSENELHETVSNIARRQSTISNFQLIQLCILIGSMVAFYFTQKYDIANQFNATNKKIDNRHVQDTLNYIHLDTKINRTTDAFDTRISVLETNRPQLNTKPKTAYNNKHGVGNWYTMRKDSTGKIHTYPATNN